MPTTFLQRHAVGNSTDLKRSVRAAGMAELMAAKAPESMVNDGALDDIEISTIMEKAFNSMANVAGAIAQVE